MIVRLRSGARPEMGILGISLKSPTSLTNVVEDVGKLAVAPIVVPTTFALEAGRTAVGTVGGAVKSDLSQIAPLVGQALRTGTGLVSTVTSGLRPPAPPVPTPATSNLPLYIGGAALALVGLVLLTRRRPAAAP